MIKQQNRKKKSHLALEELIPNFLLKEMQP
jgi:hypothetical protein